MMTNQIYLTSARKQSRTASLPILSKQNIKKAETIAVWGSIVSTAIMAISQQPLFGLPVSLCLGLNLLSRQQQTKIEQQLISTNAQIERVTKQYSSTITASEFQASLAVQSQQIQQFQQQLSQLCDRTNTLDRKQQQLAQANSTPAKKRVAIFIDGSNLYYALNQLNTRIDYTKLLKLLVGEDTLYRAIYYAGIDSSNDKEYGFINWLSHNGFRVVTKEIVKRADGSKKANLDVEIALDMVELAEQYDKAILVGGDGDFACALQKVSSQGCQVEVLSLRSATSEALIKASDRYTDLRDIVPDILKV